MSPWLEGFTRLRHYPSAVAGLVIIALLVAIAIYAVTAIPYSEAQKLWRGGEDWQDLPMNAGPVWVDRLLGGEAPRTLRVSSDDVITEREHLDGGVRLERTVLPVSFDYEDFPAEINLFLESHFEQRQPFVRLSWRTPDGETIPIEARRVGERERVSISQDRQLESRLGYAPQIGLFTDAAPGEADPSVRKGDYELVLETLQFEDHAHLDANLVVYGQVHGLFGTDHKRRDLTLALLWGTPIALAFGLLAAVGTTVTTLVIAATGVWFGGW
ncbi:MAG: ABC transporter permease, partial [Halorhodospira sp.]